MADDYQDESEGLRNQRERIKELERKLKEEEEARQALVQEREAELATQRSEKLVREFESLKLPKEAATLYPSESDVTADAVAEWASRHGITAGSQKPQTQQEKTLIEQYNDLLNAPADNREAESAMDKAIAKAHSARRNPFRPTAEEMEDARKGVEEVNAVHRAYEREVQAGRAEPIGLDGYGGRLNPPPWADRTREALQRQG